VALIASIWLCYFVLLLLDDEVRIEVGNTDHMSSGRGSPAGTQTIGFPDNVIGPFGSRVYEFGAAGPPDKRERWRTVVFCSSVVHVGVSYAGGINMMPLYIVWVDKTCPLLRGHLSSGSF